MSTDYETGIAVCTDSSIPELSLAVGAPYYAERYKQTKRRGQWSKARWAYRLYPAPGERFVVLGQAVFNLHFSWEPYRQEVRR